MATSAPGVQVLRAIGLLSSSLLLVTTLGLFKNLLAAHYFGTSRAMDTYLLALVVPDMVQFLSITGVFTFIPLFAEARAEQGETEAWRTAGRLLTFWLLLLTALLVVCFLMAGSLSFAVAPGLDPGSRATCVGQTRLLMLMALGVGAARILSAAHNARKQFLYPASAEVAFHLGSIGYLVAFHELGTIGLVGGMVLGGFCQLLVSAAALRRDRVHIPFRLELHHPAVRRMLQLSLPAYVGTAGSKINQVVNAVFASTLPAGSLSALQYAYMMVDILAAAVGASLARALAPFLSQQFAEGRREDVMRSIDRALVGTALVTMPAAAGLWLLARPIVVLLLQRGSFDARSTELTTSALSLYAPLLLGLGLNYVLATIYYSKKDTTTPMKLGLARVAMTTSLCALLAPRLGHVGIALAATVGEFVKLGLMMGHLRGKEERAALGRALGSCVRAAAAVVVMCVIVYPLSRVGQSLGLSHGVLGVAFLGTTMLVGATAYVVALRFAAASDFYYFVGQLRRLRQDDEVARAAS